MADKKPIDLSCPIRGFDENWAYKAQPEGTTPEALNVRPYDTLGQRLRGGQRAGSSKWIATQPNGAIPIQMLLQEPVPRSGTLEEFTEANGTNFDAQGSPWRHYDFSTSWLGIPAGGTAPAAWVTATTYLAGDQVAQGGNKYVCVTAHTSGVFATDLAAVKWELYTPLASPVLIQSNSYRTTLTLPGSPTAHVNQTATSTGDMTASMTVTHTGVVDESCFLGLLVRVNQAANPGYQIYYLAATSTNPPQVQVYDQAFTTLATAIVNGFPQAWATGGAAPGQTTRNTPVRLVVTVAGADMRVYLNGVLVINIVGTIGNSTQKLAGFVAYSGSNFDIDSVSISSAVAGVGNSGRVLTCSGGSLYSGFAGGAWTTVGAGMNSTGIVRGQTAFGKVYLVDGVAADYRVYDPTTLTTIAWTPTAGSLPVGASDPSLGATIIALYRGRIVLSGIADDPQNWFMSKAGDPLDWDYGATPSAVMAVAGNNSVAGLVGDRVTCLVPFNDDLMVIGCDHTLWVMRGDPADGGRIDNLSQQVGIIGPDAATIDPLGMIYFFGNGILWKLPPGGQPEPLSRGRLDKTFGTIDFNANTMRLLWDKALHGLHIFITPTTSGASTHYWWDARTDGFWPDQYPNAHGPTAVLDFDANALDDRATLLGGQDGYVRQVDPTSKTDDGTTILSKVKWGPMQPGSVHQSGRLSRVISRFDTTSDPVRLRIFAAENPQAVVAATTAAWSSVVTPLTPYSVPRVAGNSILFQVINDSFSAAWTTGHVYAVGDQVVASDGNPYISKTAHTSTTAGSHDTPPGNTTDWVLSSFRTWAIESLSAIMELAGRTRHGRL